MTDKISDPTRYALASVALANIGIGLILIGTLGLGLFSQALRDITGWALIAQAVPVALQAGAGRVWREWPLVINIISVGFAAYLILAVGHPPTATVGDAVLVIAAEVALVLLWAHLSARRLDRQFRKARHAQDPP